MILLLRTVMLKISFKEREKEEKKEIHNDLMLSLPPALNLNHPFEYYVVILRTSVVILCLLQTN